MVKKIWVDRTAFEQVLIVLGAAAIGIPILLLIGLAVASVSFFPPQEPMTWANTMSPSPHEEGALGPVILGAGILLLVLAVHPHRPRRTHGGVRRTPPNN